MGIAVLYNAVSLKTEAPNERLNPQVADLAACRSSAAYDEEHIITYLRLLDADNEGSDWRDVSRIVRRIDPDTEADRARLALECHLSRARWMTEQGYRHLLRRVPDHRDACGTRRYKPPARKLTEQREITPYKWVHPDEER